MEDASTLQAIGAGAFGFIVGWTLYTINRYRTGTVGLSDLATVIGAIGGAAILDLFPAGTDLFAAYGIGLLLGFMAYFAILAIMVSGSNEFDKNWFLDGRRKAPADGDIIPDGTAVTVRPMSEGGVGGGQG